MCVCVGLCNMCMHAASLHSFNDLDPGTVPTSQHLDHLCHVR